MTLVVEASIPKKKIKDTGLQAGIERKLSTIDTSYRCEECTKHSKGKDYYRCIENPLAVGNKTPIKSSTAVALQVFFSVIGQNIHCQISTFNIIEKCFYK